MAFHKSGSAVRSGIDECCFIVQSTVNTCEETIMADSGIDYSTSSVTALINATEFMTSVTKYNDTDVTSKPSSIFMGLSTSGLQSF